MRILNTMRIGKTMGGLTRLEGFILLCNPRTVDFVIFYFSAKLKEKVQKVNPTNKSPKKRNSRKSKFKQIFKMIHISLLHLQRFLHLCWLFVGLKKHCFYCVHYESMVLHSKTTVVLTSSNIKVVAFLICIHV